jgi:hypothetical protein
VQTIHRPPELSQPPRPRRRAHGGPPLPPIFWRGGDGGGSGWPRWRLSIVLLLILASILGLTIVLWRGAYQFPASVLAGLAVLGFYWVRERPLHREDSSSTMGRSPLWAAVGGATVFLLTHLTSPEVTWPRRVAGALGIGGALGLFAWLFGNLLITCAVVALWLLRELRRPPGWNGAA